MIPATFPQMNCRLLLLAGAAGALLGLASCTDTPSSASAAVSGLNNVLFLAVPLDTPNPPIGAVLIAGTKQATPEQTAIARKRVLAYLASLKPADAARVKAKRYVCVTTKPSPGSKGKATCMSWDTQNSSFVGNNAYDLMNPPPLNATVQFPSFTATYVGEGVGVGAPL